MLKTAIQCNHFAFHKRLIRSPINPKRSHFQKSNLTIGKPFSQVDLEVISYEPISKLNVKNPLIFVHGFNHSSSLFWPEEISSQLTLKGHCTFLLNIRGHGISLPKQHFPFAGLKEWVQDIDSLVNYISSEKKYKKKPLLVGHSAGTFCFRFFFEKQIKGKIERKKGKKAKKFSINKKLNFFTGFSFFYLF